MMVEVTVNERLAHLGFKLPVAPAPAANYVPTRVHGDLMFVAGQLPFVDGRLLATGLLGREIKVPKGYELARTAALNALSVANTALGSLDAVIIARVVVFVASSPDFYDQHLVADGASDLFVAALGDAGKHARAAVATPVLPLNSPVEVEITIGLNTLVSNSIKRNENDSATSR